MSFDRFGLDDKLLQAIGECGYQTPTPIQKQAIPFIVKGRDVLGIAQTGTGKTASFTLPMINRLMKGTAKARMPRSLILEPTRELASQVSDQFDLYGKYTKLNKALLIGGVRFGEQERSIARGADVLIATPGRLLDHIERGKVLLRGVELLVIDEADRMLDMGFIPDIEKIVRLIPPARQTLFFSATMPPAIAELSETFLSHPLRVEVAPPASIKDSLTQYLVEVKDCEQTKRAKMVRLLRDERVETGIVFCNRKRDVGSLASFLAQKGFKTASLHGDMDQYRRMEMLNKFRNGEVCFLVASDVAARGLDIPNVGHVFSYDIPTQADNYIHRVGRTGRAGRKGVAFSFFNEDERGYVENIEALIGKPIPRYKLGSRPYGSALAASGVGVGDNSPSPKSQDENIHKGKKEHFPKKPPSQPDERGHKKNNKKDNARDNVKGNVRDELRGFGKAMPPAFFNL